MEDQQGRSSADGDCRTPEKKWQQHPRGHAAPYQRRLLLPLLLALGLFMVSSVCSKFLASRGAGGRPDDNDLRLSARASVGPLADGSIVDHLSAQDDDDSVRNDSDDCTAGARFVLEGVDLVAYFSLAEGDEPVLGSSRHVSTYGNFTFQFSSERNKALFEENPTTYLPCFGGFCSYGIAQEPYWSATNLGPPTDINSWAITSDGTLRFFRSDRIRAVFLADAGALIADGDSRWTDWFGSDSTAYPFDVSCFCTVDTC